MSYRRLSKAKFAQAVAFANSNARRRAAGRPVRRVARRKTTAYRVKRGYGSIQVSNKEYLFDIIVPINSVYTGTFLATILTLQPGLPTTLPWGSKLAACYQEWDPKAWKIYYKPTCAAAVAVNSGIGIGTVMMATQYNPQELSFTNKAEMMNYQGAKSSAPAERLVLTVQTKRSKRSIGTLFIRNQNVPVGQDAKFYDLGDVTVAFQGVPAATNSYTLGEIWTAYTITFLKPKLQFFNTAQMDLITMPYAAYANPLGTQRNFGVYHDLGFGVSSDNHTLIAPQNLPPGRYLMQWAYYGTSTSAAAAIAYPTITFSSNASLVSFFNANAVGIQFSPQSGTAAGGLLTISMMWVIDYIGGTSFPLSVTFGTNGANWPTGAGSEAELMISAIRDPIV